MKICKKCGEKLTNECKICPKCKAKITVLEDIDINIDEEIDEGLEDNYTVISTKNKNKLIILYSIIGILCIIVLILGILIWNNSQNTQIPVSNMSDNLYSSSLADNLESSQTTSALTTTEAKETVSTYKVNISDSSSDSDSGVAPLESIENTEEVDLSTYMGKSISEVINKYGKDYSTYYYNDGMFIYYNSIPYYFWYGDSEATIDQNNNVNYILVLESGIDVIESIKTGMTFDEIKNVTGQEVEFSVDALGEYDYIGFVYINDYTITLKANNEFIVENAIISLTENNDTTSTEFTTIDSDSLTIDRDGKVTITDDYLDIRAGASDADEVLGKLENNTYVWVMKQKGDWYYIKTNSGGIIGYVKAEGITIK